MNEERFTELLSQWIDGDISVEESRSLEALLRENPERIERMRDELRFADLLEQQLCPWRSFDAFVNGLETRVKAEESGNAFIGELIPKLREVDRRQAVARAKLMALEGPARSRRNPARNARWGWPAFAGGLAAAALVVLVVAVLRAVGWVPGGTAVASITEIEGVIWQGEEATIEWKVGDHLKAGEGVRLLSGRARFRMSNGNHLTVEGPADLQFLSESDGVLRQGAVVADTRPAAAPFRVHGLGAEIAVEPGTTGVRMSDGVRSEAQQTATGDAGKEQAPAALAGGGMAGSEDAASGIPGALPHYRIDGEGAPVFLVLEDDDLPLLEPIRVDVVPGMEPAPSLASHESPESRPAIASVSRVRSYLVQVGDVANASNRDGDSIDATVRFDRPILGISTMEDTLEMGDQLTGYDPKRLFGGASEWKRGLKAPNDFVQIGADGKTLELRVRKQDADRVPQVRVFVERE